MNQHESGRLKPCYRALFAPVSWLNGPLAESYGESNSWLSNSWRIGLVEHGARNYQPSRTRSHFAAINWCWLGEEASIDVVTGPLTR